MATKKKTAPKKPAPAASPDPTPIAAAPAPAVPDRASPTVIPGAVKRARGQVTYNHRFVHLSEAVSIVEEIGCEYTVEVTVHMDAAEYQSYLALGKARTQAYLDSKKAG